MFFLYSFSFIAAIYYGIFIAIPFIQKYKYLCLNESVTCVNGISIGYNIDLLTNIKNAKKNNNNYQ